MRGVRDRQRIHLTQEIAKASQRAKGQRIRGSGLGNGTRGARTRWGCRWGWAWRQHGVELASKVVEAIRHRQITSCAACREKGGWSQGRLWGPTIFVRKNAPRRLEVCSRMEQEASTLHRFREEVAKRRLALEHAGVELLFEYHDEGSGECVVLLPPAAGTALCWYRQVLGLSVQGFRVVSVSWPAVSDGRLLVQVLDVRCSGGCGVVCARPRGLTEFLPAILRQSRPGPLSSGRCRSRGLRRTAVRALWEWGWVADTLIFQGSSCGVAGRGALC